MRKLALIMLSVVILASVSMADGKAPAAKAQKMSGFISDEQCGAKGLDNIDCVKRCISQGKKMVFVSDKDHAVQAIVNQAIAKGHEGQHVNIMAKEGKVGLQISKIEQAK